MTDIDLEAAINYVRPVAESATVGMYGAMLTTVLNAAARLREAETVIGAIDAIEPMWPRGMYGAPQDMIGRNQIRSILSRYKTTKTESTDRENTKETP